MLTSAKLFFRGPVWAAASVVGGGFTLVGILGGAFWMWFSFGLACLVSAAFYGFHQNRLAALADMQSLPRQIDDLHREGIDLLDDLSAPVEAEQTGKGTWSLPIFPPPDRGDKAEAFDQRIRDLLIAHYPALLSDYANGFNAYRRKQREQEAAIHPDPDEDQRSNAVKMREFTDYTHALPARVVEASLEGLAVARHRVND